MESKPLVLILGAESSPTDELARAIKARCGDNVETRFATNNREAQRVVRRERFVAIVATEHQFEGFCAEMVPELTSHGRTLDVIVCPHNPDLDYYLEPYGITEFTSVEAAAADVLMAVDHQIAVDEEVPGKIKLGG